MTFEEAKKILEEEGFYVEKATVPGVLNGWFTEYESPEICEAMQVVYSAGYKILMFKHVFEARKARLKKEYGKNHIKGDFSGNKSIEHCGEPGPGEEQPNEGNPALNESASQFNDALLDEQAKKIAELTKKNERLGKEIARLNKNIYKKNLKIEELRKESSRHLRGMIKMFGENMDLEQMLKDKNAVLSDVAEELRLTKIREKNLTEVGQKYVGENEKLKEELADKVVDKIDAQALKSAESALAWKEKVIAEKNEVIVDLGRKLKAQKDLVDDISLKYDGAKHNLKLRMDECEKLKKELEKMTKLVEIVRNASKEYCDYGVAANEFIKELAYLYVLAENNGIINLDMLERCKNYQTYGFPANCNRETKKEIDDIAKGDKNKKPRIPTPEESKYDSIIERCKRLGIELHYHDGKVPTYTNAFGDEVPVYGLRGIFAICTDEEYKSLFKK